ncbi:hypothetical protein M2352_004224 [Azospirillum fermentarium]|uniref:putative virulence factor n=1 Tax=Azospirillum fermentarium TaxID=1233114 RepID=UPI002227DE0F|nr:putative virulence factor [Azospirillum fermentarium]MCW2248564.1 hypothetical protein [Azospirillum fermentarium]
MTQGDNTLVDGVRRLAEGSRQARLWIDAVRGGAVSVANEAHGLSTATRRAENLARKLAGAAGRRNCAGVFGPSQAGKSYLVSALARKPPQQLQACFGPLRKDFLTEINPPGDRESTGLVTRFTIHGGGVTDPEHPVELRMLTETDLVKILANSFLSDFDPNNMTVPLPDEAEIRQVLAAAQAEATGPAAPHLDEIALYDLGDYFQRNFAARIKTLNGTDYWDAVIRTAGRLPLARRAQVYAMLWGGLPAFTELFVMLAGALERLGHPTDAHAALTALIPRERSIIDVMLVKQRLGTAEDAADPVSVRPMAAGGALGPAVPVPRAVLCALVAELKIVMNDRPWGFFEHTDLLDFPGARSRLKLTSLPADAADRSEQVRELLLRGKIAYLFQRYSEERELTAMLLCMPPSVAEVKDLAALVRGWIEVTHGATPALRAQVRNALFLVLTKFDLEFLEKGGETADSRRGKWDRRLDASFLEMYGKDGWPHDWDGRPFDNSLFLRNPGMRQEHLMDYDESAGGQGLVETGPARRHAERLAEYRGAFDASPLCRTHFRNPAEVWEAAFAPNDGGVGLLVRRLDAVLDPNLKANQIRQRLMSEAAGLHASLKRFYHAADDASRTEREQALGSLRVRLNTALKPGDYALFGLLLERLMMPADDVVEIFLNVAALRLDRVAPPPADAAPVDDDDPWAEEPAGAAPAAAAKAPPDRPEIFAGLMMNAWTERLRTLSRDAGLLAHLGLGADVLDQLVQEVIIGANRLDLRRQIADGVRAQVQAANTRWDDVVERAAGIALMRLNDYVAYLGFGEADETGRPGFPEAPKPRQRAVFTLPPLPERLPALGTQRQLIDRERFIDWGVALRQLGLDNIAFAGGREIDEQQNRALGAILATIDLAS